MDIFLCLGQMHDFFCQVTDLERELVEGAAGVRAVKSQMQIRISDLEDELKELVATLRARVLLCTPFLLTN